MRARELVIFMREREAIRLRREDLTRDPTKALTKDRILLRYRFTNVHREDDRVTKWVAKHWRTPWRAEPDLWFAMVVACLFNQPDALAMITEYVLPFDKSKIRARLRYRAEGGERNFNAAYIVSTNGHSGNKVDYIIDKVLAPLWTQRETIRPIAGDSLERFHARLIQYDGMGSFMAAQVVAYLKYEKPLSQAHDWYTWAAPGPGSKRGLNRVCNKPVDAPWPGTSWQLALGLLQTAVAARDAHFATLHAQDLQNCLCEFDKYERVRLGEGTPKQLYKENRTEV